jgi:hypothetical protein
VSPAAVSNVAQAIVGGWTPPLPDPKWTTEPPFEVLLGDLRLGIDQMNWQIADALLPSIERLAGTLREMGL